MKKINFNVPVKALDGSDFIENGQPVIIAKRLAELLINSQSSDPLKMRSICKRLYEFGEIELDESDMLFLKNNVLENKVATDLFKGEVLFVLSQC